MRLVLFFFLLLLLFAIASSLQKTYAGEPLKIIIPRLSLSLPVVSVPISNDTWEVSTAAASFGESSAKPGQIGNTVIFAHAKPQMFQSLPNLQTGDVIHLLTKSRWFTYKVHNTTVVDPKDTSVLTAKRPFELTIYTCIGKQFEKRFVAKAALIATPFTLTIGRPSYAKASEGKRGVN
ncbi:MAG: sortase [Candidatus Levybacteria bacterium]|nr:sortase [Candidatus Levybacteria bacterium]